MQIKCKRKQLILVFLLKNRQVETNGTTTKHGLLYDVNMSFIYHLTDDDDCDYWRPYIQCNYSEGVRFTVHANASYSIPCKGLFYFCNF